MKHSPGCKCSDCRGGNKVPGYAEGGQIRDSSSHRTPGQIKRMDKGYNRVHQDRIVERHKARRVLMKEGKVHKGDRMDVDHIRPLYKGGSNSPSNWRVRTAHANRGWEKGK